MTMIEFLTAVVIAIIGSNGLWMCFSKVIDKNSQKTKDLQELKETVVSIKGDIVSLSKLTERTNNLAKATSRERLNSLNHKYRQQGYIPSEDLVAYKLIGEAYEEADGNTVVYEEFKLCMEELPRK